ncbi:amino acid ABC transporter permease [Comamonas resistens]|uniref:Amino acid ABC transporter permease n=1 Tax=Comamonas resistens TaxID=3046670 RepID=A0ABY8SN73_9BURK|nr:amino acid ABC transporter permease [Comamonas resistens]MDL5038391.1 amino acid ABC transporter permease [Comamonas resistens]WHS64544.1 amino acid ABC transporter permease [Comamonas resistens]
MNFSALADDWVYLLLGTFPEGPPGGALLTLILSATSGIASALLGLVLGIALVVSRGWASQLLHGVLGFLRAIPVLMLIFWIYFLLPMLLGMDVPGTVSVVCALSLIGGAYLAHGVAAGIRAIAQGQWDAGSALGMSRWQVLRWVVLPQALSAMLPSFVNQWVTLIKDSSLAYIVGVGELSFLSTQVNARLMVHPAEVFLLVGAVYWLLCSVLNLLAWAMTQKLQPSPL